MASEIRLIDKTFVPYLREDQLLKRIGEIAGQIRSDYGSEKVLFLSVLNGSFMFTSDLMKCLDGDVELSFIKLSSYDGVESTGKVYELIGLNQNVQGKHIVVIEDIVDTGLTVERVSNMLKLQNPL